jgi:hypothetical protein
MSVAVLVVCSFAVAAEAQQGGSAIRGRVTDEQKGVLPGVTIVVTHQDNGTVRETTSGDDGTYLVPGIVPGPYRITAQLMGFRRLTQGDLVVRVGATLQVDLALQVGGLEESITVTGEAPQVDLTSAQVGGNVGSGDLTNLPSGSRNFTGLVALLPGVVYNAAADSSSDSVTINGQNGSGVVYLMDGGSNNDDLRGGSSGAQARPPLESIQEFQVVTNQFDAEYGAATAGVVNAVSKQGDESLAWERLRVLHRCLDDGEGLLRRAAESDEARDDEEAVGRHDWRADRPRQDAFLRQLRAAGSSRRPKPSLPDAAGPELHGRAENRLLELHGAHGPPAEFQPQLQRALPVGSPAELQPGAR